MTAMAVAFALGMLTSLPSQDAKARPAPPGIDPKRVDQAIEKGVAFLKTSGSPGHTLNKDGDELILWTFVHALVPESDPKFQTLLMKVLESPLATTYKVSLQAMILEELDRVRHQRRIWQCAQFLVDNQNGLGQWGYGEPSEFVDGIPTVANGPKGTTPSTKATATRGAAAAKRGPEIRVKPEVKTWLSVQKRREGQARGDNSNSQYAALGLRACHDAGIHLPDAVIASAEKWWRQSQEGRPPGPNADSSVSGEPGPAGAAEGWGYCKEGLKQKPFYGSMTAGGLGALVIYNHVQGKPWKKDPDILSGLAWLNDNFSVAENPRRPDGSWQYYYLYALERAGILYGTEFLGSHEWHVEGTRFLLDAQNPDGSWLTSKGPRAQAKAVWDTCFAILFLRRATRPLIDVASVDRFHQERKR